MCSRPSRRTVLATQSSPPSGRPRFVDGDAGALRRRLESPTLHVSGQRVDVARAAAECDLAVLNGGHGVTAQMLRAGKPVLAVPLNLEQQMTGDALGRLGAGESVPGRKGQPWPGAARLDALLADDGEGGGGRYAAAARRFAARYAAFDPARQRRAMLERAEELLAGWEGASVDPAEPVEPHASEVAAV